VGGGQSVEQHPRAAPWIGLAHVHSGTEQRFRRPTRRTRPNQGRNGTLGSPTPTLYGDFGERHLLQVGRISMGLQGIQPPHRERDGSRSAQSKSHKSGDRKDARGTVNHLQGALFPARSDYRSRQVFWLVPRHAPFPVAQWVVAACGGCGTYSCGYSSGIQPDSLFSTRTRTFLTRAPRTNQR
jgi:hypothetical protein